MHLNLHNPTHADEESLPPRLSRTGSTSVAKRRLFSRFGRLGVAATQLSRGQRAAGAAAAGAAALLLLVVALSSGLSKLDGSPGGGRPARELPASRLLLAGRQWRRGGRLGRVSAEDQLPWQTAVQLWNVSALLTVGGGVEPSALAGPMREPFLHALMPAVAGAAGGVQIVAAATHWVQPLPATAEAAQGAAGALVSASFLLRPRAARQLAAALPEQQQLALRSPRPASGSSATTWQGTLAVQVVNVSAAAAECNPQAVKQGSPPHALLGCREAGAAAA